MLTPNPTNDRLKFILKTYGAKRPVLVMDMVAIIAATVGADGWFQRLRQAGIEAKDAAFVGDLDVWGHGSRSPHHTKEPPSVSFLNAVVDLMVEMPQFKTRHRADPIFPWIAQQLAKLPSLPPAADGTDTRMTAWVRKLARGGTMLAQWYEAKRPNLGQYSLDEAWDEAARWEEEENPIPQGEVVAELSDGWTAQKLTTAEQLNAEGEKMQHCVGSYASEVAGKYTTIYSLRDAKGQPHVTIEVKNKRIAQTQGKQNAKPAEKYQKYIDEFHEWLREQDIATDRYPAYLMPYVEALEEHGDIDDESIESYAEGWREQMSIADAIEWMKQGFAHEPRIAGALNDEHVTPEEFETFSYGVHRKITETGDVPNNLDDLVKIARMALVLKKLAPDRDDSSVATSSQLAIGFDEDEDFVPGRSIVQRARVPGHDPTGLEPIKFRWEQQPRSRWPSISFEAWDDNDSDVEWLYPAEEWIAEDFSHDDSEDEYVGPWFRHRFTPEQATEWWDLGVEDGDLANELRARRVTPEMLVNHDVSDSITEFDKLKSQARREWLRTPTSDDHAKKISEDRLYAAYARYTKVIAQQIAEQLSDAGLRRNTRRTSRRR